VRYQIFYITLH